LKRKKGEPDFPDGYRCPNDKLAERGKKKKKKKKRKKKKKGVRVRPRKKG